MSKKINKLPYFITGSSSGIGFEVARLLLSRGLSVVGLSRSEPPLTSEKFSWVECDLRSATSADLTQALIHWSFSGFAGVFLNAGVYTSFDMEAWDLEILKSQLDINFYANARLCRILRPFLSSDSSRTLIFNSSDQATKYKNGGLAYGISKAALSALARGLAVEWATDGIDVITLMPGGVDTRLYRDTKAGLSEEQIRESQKKYPVGRVASVGEVADMVVYLLLKNNRALNGAEIRMDGGLGCL